jgi:integrase
MQTIILSMYHHIPKSGYIARNTYVQKGYFIHKNGYERLTMSVESSNPNANPVIVWLQHTGMNTKRARFSSLRSILDSLGKTEQDPFLFDWSTISYEDLVLVRSRLQTTGYSASTINCHLSSVRTLLKTYLNLGVITVDAYNRVVSIEGITKQEYRLGKSLEVNEITRLLQLCDREYAETDNVMAIRDGTIIALMYSTGIRRAEVIRILRDDVDLTIGEIRVQNPRQQRQRTIYIRGNVLKRLEHWLSVYANNPCRNLFPSFTNSGNMTRRPIRNSNTIYNLIKKRGLQAGIAEFSPLNLRFTTNPELSDSNNLSVIGHASMNIHAYRYSEHVDTLTGWFVDTPI